MGDRHDRARVLLEEAFEPVDRLGVEVVGRLVEQQQVGVAEEEPGERDATLLAAGQLRDVGVVGRAAQGVHRDVDVALEVPGVGRGDLVLEGRLLGTDLLVVGVGVGPGGHDRVVLVDEGLDLGDAVHDVALDVLGRVELGLLAQVADGEAGRQAGLADEAVVEPGHDPEEGRLAGPVRADDADLGARVERERDVLEDRLVGRVVPGELVRGVDEFVGHAVKGSGPARDRGSELNMHAKVADTLRRVAFQHSFSRRDCTHLEAVPGSDTHQAGVPLVRRGRLALARAADVPDVRVDRLLRQFGRSACARPFRGDRSSHHPIDRTRRGVGLVLSGPGLPQSRRVLDA